MSNQQFIVTLQALEDPPCVAELASPSLSLLEKFAEARFGHCTLSCVCDGNVVSLQSDGDLANAFRCNFGPLLVNVAPAADGESAVGLVCRSQDKFRRKQERVRAQYVAKLDKPGLGDRKRLVLEKKLQKKLQTLEDKAQKAQMKTQMKMQTKMQKHGRAKRARGTPANVEELRAGRAEKQARKLAQTQLKKQQKHEQKLRKAEAKARAKAEKEARKAAFLEQKAAKKAARQQACAARKQVMANLKQSALALGKMESWPADCSRVVLDGTCMAELAPCLRTLAEQGRGALVAPILLDLASVFTAAAPTGTTVVLLLAEPSTVPSQVLCEGRLLVLAGVRDAQAEMASWLPLRASTASPEQKSSSSSSSPSSSSSNNSSSSSSSSSSSDSSSSSSSSDSSSESKQQAAADADSRGTAILRSAVRGVVSSAAVTQLLFVTLKRRALAVHSAGGSWATPRAWANWTARAVAGRSFMVGGLCLDTLDDFVRPFAVEQLRAQE